MTARSAAGKRSATLLAARVHAAEARTAETQSTLSSKCVASLPESPESTQRQWEEERHALAASLQAAEARSGDAQSTLDQDVASSPCRTKTRSASGRRTARRRSPRCRPWSPGLPTSIRRSREKRRERTEAHEREQLRWKGDRTALLTELHATPRPSLRTSSTRWNESDARERRRGKTTSAGGTPSKPRPRQELHAARAQAGLTCAPAWNGERQERMEAHEADRRRWGERARRAAEGLANGGTTDSGRTSRSRSRTTGALGSTRQRAASSKRSSRSSSRPPTHSKTGTRLCWHGCRPSKRKH